MGDLINRQDAIDLCDWYDNPSMHDDLVKLPSAEPDRKKGKWVSTDDGLGGEYFVCSVCGCPWILIEGSPEDNAMNFCPNCGADMRGEKDDNT